MAKATKEKDTNKEKPMEATAHTTKEKPKENNNHGTSQKEETKATKKRQKERLAKEKGRIQQRCATDVANQATWQRIAEQRCTTCQRHRRNKTKMEQHNGMTQTVGTTTIGTAMTNQATTTLGDFLKCSNQLGELGPSGCG